ncbi:MAG: hypothetical protein QOJ95_1138 [Mycobacterium sp.]|nr:hypothetical protein [Mycobacterium sp.]
MATETHQTQPRPSGLFHDAVDEFASTTKHWWLLLVTGVAWVVIAILILRFDYTTVAAIAVLFGVFCFAAAANEVMVSAVTSSRGWRILHWLLAVLFIVVGVFAFFRPGDTFVGLAAVMSFYFVFRGSFDIATSLAASRVPGWWVLLLVGIAEIALGFWAAGSWNASIVVLVSWVAAGALIHGIGQIASAFLVRKVGHSAAALDGQHAGAAAT